MAGIIIAVLSLIVYFFVSKKEYGFKLIVLFALFISSGFIYGFYDARVNNNSDYNAVESRSYIFKEFEARDVYYNYLGAGFFQNENEPFGVTNLSGAEVRDSSFLVYLFFSAGGVGLISFCLIFILINGLRSSFIFLPMFLFKYHFVFGPLWLIFLLAKLYRRK